MIVGIKVLTIVSVSVLTNLRGKVNTGKRRWLADGEARALGSRSQKGNGDTKKISTAYARKVINKSRILHIYCLDIGLTAVILRTSSL